jgi:hypothetical protein
LTTINKNNTISANNDYDSELIFKYLPNSSSNNNKSSKPVSANLKEASRATKNSSKFNLGGLFNWVSKYPDFFNQSEQYENPAMILEDDKQSSTQTDTHKVSQRMFKSDAALAHSNSAQKEFFSYKKLRGGAKDRRSRKNSASIANLSDLESASQMPSHMQNPSYLFEEQEGSVDLRSEYSYCGAGNSSKMIANHVETSLPRVKHNYNLKQHINTWKEVF